MAVVKGPRPQDPLIDSRVVAFLQGLEGIEGWRVMVILTEILASCSVMLAAQNGKRPQAPLDDIYDLALLAIEALENRR